MIGCCHGFAISAVVNGKQGFFETDDSNMIQDLPIEIITRILKHFDSSELMSLAYESLPARVNEALHAKSLWRFKTLHIRNNADFKRCMANLPRIQFCEKISFAGSQIHRQQMVDLLSIMKNIRCLSFDGFLDLCDGALQSVLQQHGNELRILDLTGCQYLTNFSIKQVARRCRKLHTLILDECSFSSAALEILAESEELVDCLKHLDISKCYLMDSSVIVPLAKLNQLRILKMRSHEWLNASNLPYILAPLPQIRQIDIRNCDDFTRSGIDEVKRSLSTEVEILENTKLIDDSEESIRGYLMALISAQV
jgi:hypothetical protein